MKLLAIDTSNWPLGVAVTDQHKLLGELNTHIPKNHSLRLMPAVEQLLHEVQVAPQDLDGIIVAQGPGSYTGVRIGVTTAKVMAWSLRIPLVGVSSLQIIAQNRIDFQESIIPMFDARRGNAYIGEYKVNTRNCAAEAVEPDKWTNVDSFCQQLKARDDSFLFIGEGAVLHQQTIHERLGSNASIGREIDHTPRASQLAFLGEQQWDHRVEGEDIHHFHPTYLQLAEAEAKWLAKQSQD